VRDEKEIIVGGFLGVRVSRGAQLVRKKDDAKLHHSYEVACCDMLTYCVFRSPCVFSAVPLLSLPVGLTNCTHATT
jgi:hypothetical protein